MNQTNPTLPKPPTPAERRVLVLLARGGYVVSAGNTLLLFHAFGPMSGEPVDVRVCQVLIANAWIAEDHDGRWQLAPAGRALVTRKCGAP